MLCIQSYATTMIISNTTKPFAAISYDTLIFQDLLIFMQQENIKLIRIDPTEFLFNSSNDYQYINLVVRDTKERQQIVNHLDTNKLSRFTYIHPNVINDGTVNPGCMIYPGTIIYRNALINKDVIIHSHCEAAHNVIINQGSYLSGRVTIGGSSVIGKFTNLMIGVIIYDKITVCDNVTIGAGTIVRKSITLPGTYSTIPNKITKLK